MPVPLLLAQGGHSLVASILQMTSASSISAMTRTSLALTPVMSSDIAPGGVYRFLRLALGFRFAAFVSFAGAGSSGGAPVLGSAPGNTGASPSGVTMIE